MWWAHLTTSYFHFDAFGSTEADALEVMYGLIRDHCDRREVDYGYFMDTYEDDIDVLEIKIGYGYVDRSHLWDREKA